MFINDYFDDRDQWSGQVAENSARGALAWGQVHTNGTGELTLDDPILFGVTFVHEPIVMYGFALQDDDQLVAGRFPRCSGGVLRWVTDAEDFYVGAHVFVTVATADPLLAAQSQNVPADFGQEPAYDILHSFTFSALAMKDMMS